MVFHTNNFEWSASTVAGPCKARWAVELLFRELKQTLRPQSFFGESQNAAEWQIWAAMPTHLVLRHIKWKDDVSSPCTRSAATIKNTIWLKRSLEAVISFHCMAPGQSGPPPDDGMPYLPGFERLAIAWHPAARAATAAFGGWNKHAHNENHLMKLSLWAKNGLERDPFSSSKYPVAW